MLDDVIALLIGAFTGLNSGMFGIGGALLATPLLRVLLDLGEHLSVATPLPAAIPAAVSGSIAYVRNGLVRFDIVWRSLVAAIPMSQIGVLLTGETSGLVLMIFTGAMLVYSAYMFIRRGFAKDRPSEPAASASARAVDVGNWKVYAGSAAAGFVSGYLAIGGGILLVPLFVKVLKLETKQAVATSLLCVAALAIPGSILHAVEGNIAPRVALMLAIGVIPFGYLGARIASSLRTKTLERVYGLVMLVFAIWFIVTELTLQSAG